MLLKSIRTTPLSSHFLEILILVLLVHIFFLKKRRQVFLDEKDAEEYVRPYTSFSEFVLNGLKTAINEKQIHFIPQTYWIKDENQNYIVDKVEKTDNFKLLCDWLLRKTENSFDFHMRNQSSHKKWNHYYDSFEVIEHVRQYRRHKIF